MRAAGGAPLVALFVAGALRLADGGDDHVEVEILDALLVLRRVDGADARRNPQPLQVLRVGPDHPFEGGGDEQELDLHRRPGRLADQRAVADDPARVLEQSARLAQVGADRPPGGARRREGRAERRFGQAAAEAFEYLRLQPLRAPGRGELGVGVETLRRAYWP